jgi:hypothetical protein
MDNLDQRDLADRIVANIDEYLNASGVVPRDDPERGKPDSSRAKEGANREDQRALKLKLLGRLDEDRQKLEGIEDSRIDRRFHVVIIAFATTSLVISALVFYALYNAPSNGQISLVAGAVGEGGIFYIVVREYKRFLEASAQIRTFSLVRQALDFGRFCPSSLPDGDVVKAMIMIKETIGAIYGVGAGTPPEGSKKGQSGTSPKTTQRKRTLTEPRPHVG